MDKRFYSRQLKTLLQRDAEIDESWGPCLFCGSKKRLEHAPECLDHMDDCSLKCEIRSLQKLLRNWCSSTET